MAFNFTDLVAKEMQKQADASNTSSGGGLGYKTLYPYANGRLELKFIGNEPSGLLYRELTFHDYKADNKKISVPCFRHMYGMDCPICNAIENVQNTLDDKNVFRTYGFKKRGIMFAKLIGYSPDNYFGDGNNTPKSGDIVLFMFPKSVINELSKLIVEFQDEIETLFVNNTTRNITLKVGTQANGFPEYTFYPKGTSSTLCVTESGEPDESAFNEFMSKMPDLREVKFASKPTDEYVKIQKTIVEAINNQYFGNVDVTKAHMQAAPMSVPNPVQNQPQQTVNTSSSVDLLAPTVTPEQINLSVTEDLSNIDAVGASKPLGERPPCYGDNKYNEECAACPWDSECV